MPSPQQNSALPEAPQEAHWPDWIENTRLDDTLSAQAYERTPPSCRAALKTGLALAYMHFGENSGHCHEEGLNRCRGFWRHAASFPAPWAVVVFTPDYAAAARLSAACVPALLAGVPLVSAVCVGGPPSGPAQVALELSGVEDIFVLDATALRTLLEESQPGPGRLVLLHKGELDDAARAARELGVPCFEERRAPSLVLPEPDGFDLEALAFAQGEALEHALEPSHPSMPTVLYLKSLAAQGHCKARRHGPFRYAGSLALAPGCEGFWLHAGLTPDFFRVARMAFGPLNVQPE